MAFLSGGDEQAVGHVKLGREPYHAYLVEGGRGPELDEA